jgi:protein-S-isoprenylcysteine O-methyltransferase Ste14
MALREELVDQGNWLFKHRSYLPIPFLLVVIFALWGAEPIFGSAFLTGVWKLLTVLIASAGAVFRIYTVAFVPKNTSGRNTGKQRAGVLNTTGIYSVVRHPLYVGNFIVMFGLTLYAHNLWLVAVFILLFWVYYERIMIAEETFLQGKFGDQYDEWAKLTPAFIPRWSQWVASDREFSVSMVLRREYSGIFAMVASFTFLELLSNWFQTGTWHLGLIWLYFFFSFFVIYILLRLRKKGFKKFF